MTEGKSNTSILAQLGWYLFSGVALFLLMIVILLRWFTDRRRKRRNALLVEEEALKYQCKLHESELESSDLEFTVEKMKGQGPYPQADIEWSPVCSRSSTTSLAINKVSVIYNSEENSTKKLIDG